MKNDIFAQEEATFVGMAGEKTLPVTPRVQIQPHRSPLKSFWERWSPALRQVFPLVIAVYLTAFVLTCFSLLIARPDFSPIVPPISALWTVWQRMDTNHFLSIVNNGYHTLEDTAFFPLYPMLIRALAFLIPSPLIAALIASGVSMIGALVALYQLVSSDFGQERAQRAVLYLLAFPTAFFLVAGYNESLFLCLTLFSFYHMRRGQWWWAGLFGFLAALTRSAGIFLLLPFAYEYMRQRAFRWREIGGGVLSMLLIPAALLCFVVYCKWRFGDPLAFSHAQALWQRKLEPPWFGIQRTLGHIVAGKGLLSYLSLRNAIDLVPDLLAITMLVLGAVGPWRLRREHWAYLIYGFAMLLFFQLFPDLYVDQLLSVARFLLELFPLFIMLSIVGRYRLMNYCYLMVSGASGAALLLMFLMGRWIV